MNTVIANQYGRVQGELNGKGLVLAVEAQTPRRESVSLRIPLESPVKQLYLIAILAAVERRINQVQLKNSNLPEEGLQEEQNSSPPEVDLFESTAASKHKVYGRFPSFLIYEQLEQSRLRVFFAARDEQKRIARFDLNPGVVEALRALAERALFSASRIDLLLRDELSLAVSLTASRKGMVFDVHTPLWQSPFVIGNPNNLGTLAVFLRRALNSYKTAPIQFDTDAAGILFRKKPDGRVLVEFRHRDSTEYLTLSRLQLYEMEILSRYVLRLCFEPEVVEAGARMGEDAMTSTCT